MKIEYLVFYFLGMKVDGELSSSGSRAVTLTQSQGGVVELMGRNGGALEMLFLIRNTVKDTSIEAAIVQESLWKAKMAMLSPVPPLLKWGP